MPAALQCPDCGHQEMLDNVGSATTFRCGGCGRALKVPAQFRTPPEGRNTGPGSRPDSPLERTQAMQQVPSAAPPLATPPLATPSTRPPMATPPATAPVGMSAVPTTVVPATAPPGVGTGAVPPAGRPPAALSGAAPGGATPTPTTPLRPPLVLRLAVWAIALPLGSLIVFILASSLGFLTRGQLEDTILLPGWGRFVPIARLLPFCALFTALLVQLGVFGLERFRDRNLRRGPPSRRRSSGGGRGGGGRPRRPMSPPGQGQGVTNGSRSRDRVIS